MNMVEIERALRQLRLSGIAETLSTRVMQAQVAQEPFLQTFAAMLQDELDRRRSRLTERRYKRSGLDEKVTLADFDWRFNPKLPRAACFELHTLKFIAEGANALIVGKPGTGKSHLAKAVAYQATLAGHDVRYLEADTEFDLEMKALDMLPRECFAQRHGKHVPEVWPIDSAEGLRLALAGGLIQPDATLPRA